MNKQMKDIIEVMDDCVISMKKKVIYSIIIVSVIIILSVAVTYAVYTFSGVVNISGTVNVLMLIMLKDKI